MPLVDDAAR